MKSKWRALGLIACAALAVGACSKGGGGGVVAKVDNRQITLSYYQDRLEKMDRKFLPDTLDLKGKRKFLDFIINKELMAKKAEELKYGEDPQLKSNMKLILDNLTLSTAVDKITAGKLEATDQEVQDFFAHKQHEVLAKHILVSERSQAEEVLKAIHAGANFDSLANVHSIVPRQDEKTGHELTSDERVVFGWVKYGEAMIPVETAVFSLKLNEVSAPVQTGYGWHLFKMVSERDNKLEALNDLRPSFETQIKLRKKRLIVEKYYEDILQEHHFKLDEPAINLTFAKLPPDVNPENRPDAATEVKPVLPFTNEERAKLLFEVDGKKYTLGDFSDKYDNTSWFERPKRYSGALGMRYWIRDNWLKPLQLQRAIKNGIDQSPEVQNELNLRREQMMVAMLHQNLVGSQAPEATEPQLQEFYDKHKDIYVQKEMRRCNIIYNLKEKVVRRAYDEVKAGGDFVTIAMKYNEGATKPEEVRTPDFTRDTPKSLELAEKVWNLQQGEYTEPFKTTQAGGGGGWVVAQLDRIVSQRQIELKDIHDQVAGDYKNQWSEDRLNELLAQWKKDSKITVDEKVLEKAQIKRTDVFVPGRVAGAEGTKATSGDAP